jgi:glycosyltransferase involved in cell wall biosynthesis
MKLSLVIPSFNQGEFIRDTLESLFQQRRISRRELEVVVIDGGSSDGTVDILRAAADKLDHWASEPDAGQTAALQKGFSMCTGDVFGWLCADDLLAPDTVREVLDFFALNKGVEFVYGDARWMDRAGRFSGLKREIPFFWFIWLNDHNYIPQPAAFWKRELYEDVGGLDVDLDVAMDADLFGKFARRQRPHHVRRVWALMRRHPQQKTQRLRVRGCREHKLIRSRFGRSAEGALMSWCRHTAARCVRVTWKLFIGSYSPLNLKGWIRDRSSAQG